MHKVRLLSVGVAVVVLGGCSGADSKAAKPAPSTTVAKSSGTTTTPSTGTEDQSSDKGFVIPAAVREAAGSHAVDVEYPAQPKGVAWPTTDWPTGPLPAGVDQKVLDDVVAKAFESHSAQDGTIDAVLAVQGGKLVYEKYNNWDPNTPHISWSMAKSITQALLGILVRDGKVDPFAPVNAPEWAAADDPRHGITFDQLMTMSSGLTWSESYVAGQGDTIPMLYGVGKDDRAHYAADKPLVAEPGTTFNYSTGTPNIIGRAVTEQVGTGDAFVAWAQKELFGPLGITQVNESFDATGVPSSGSNINLTPRDYARFGTLYLRGGNWDGTQILPKEWVDLARLPTPTDEKHRYGRLWWLLPDRPGTFYADGFNGQSITVEPDHDLVVVIVSNTSTSRADDTRLGVLNAFDDMTS